MPSLVGATDFISWESLGREGTILLNPTYSTTANGMRFSVAKPAAGAMRLSQELNSGAIGLFVNTQNSGSVTIEFERPVSAVGAQLVVSNSSFTSVTVRAYDPSGNLLLETSEGHVSNLFVGPKYMGAVATREVIKMVEFSTDAGCTSLGRVELRPYARYGFDAGTPDSLGLFEGKASGTPIATDQEFSIPKNGSIVSPTPNVRASCQNADSVRLTVKPEHAEVFNLMPDGSFVYEPERDFVGMDSFEYVAVTDQGRSESKPAVANLRVLPVNSQPRFTGGPDQTCEQDANPQVVSKWASDITAGAHDEEAVQHLAWIVKTDKPDLFAEQPILYADGTLRYAPVRHGKGLARVTVWLKDDGGTANGGFDTSRPYTFLIAIAHTARRPIISPLSDATVILGEALDLRAKATALDNEQTLIYSLQNAPDGMSIDPLGGEIRWTPRPAEKAGEIEATVRVSVNADPRLFDETTLHIRVLGRQDVPAIQAIPSRTVEPGRPVRFSVAPKGARAGLAYLMGSSVRGANLDLRTGEFSWTPTGADAGQTRQFLVSAFDPESGKLANVTQFSVTVPRSRALAVVRPVPPGPHSTKRSAPPLMRSLTAARPAPSRRPAAPPSRPKQTVAAKAKATSARQVVAQKGSSKATGSPLKAQSKPIAQTVVAAVRAIGAKTVSQATSQIYRPTAMGSTNCGWGRYSVE
ncbi:MAG: hypothetical protein HYR64_09390 [Fimbriimonas ginsengisoli]|uniref:Cadherin repeat domain-containing protein n=1 Tax=Fimbriimonas ginsengisoli TaxID=1005039 RepID=A0A931PUC9_FIMGI|nr:hypothetical protein [Fimbriimonas ginsengisoli]